MRCVTHEVDHWSKSDVFEVVPLGDLHLGNALCDESLIKATVKHIERTANCYWGGMGDVADFINRSDPRYRPSHTAPWLHSADDMAKEQIEYIVELLTPIAGKCLWFLRGNHEDTILKHYERDVYYELAQKLGHSATNRIGLGYRGFSRVRFRRFSKANPEQPPCVETFVFYVAHGYGGGRLAGSKALKLSRLPNSYNADIYLYGHDHWRTCQLGHMIGPGHKTDAIIGRDTLQAFTGGFLRSYSDKEPEWPDRGDESYAGMNDLPPMGTGSIIIRLQPYGHRITVTE